jgi:hypothetical protein
MNLGAQAATRTADRLIFRPPFLAPAACWWARTMVESTISDAVWLGEAAVVLAVYMQFRPWQGAREG